ncbi:MAG: cobalamin-dependent protein [Candidatus Helarchaeota archaeon]
MIDILLLHPPPDLELRDMKKSLMYKVEVWNLPLAFMHGFTREDIVALIKHHRPFLVGIELNWLQFGAGAIGLAKLVKGIDPNIRVALGGVHASIFAGHILTNYKEVDAVFIGEAEASFLEYAEKVEQNRDLTQINSSILRIEDKIFENYKPKTLPVDDIPPYSLSFIKPRMKESFNIGTINTCRGPCIFNCPYCIGSCNNYRLMLGSRDKLELHSPEWILKQLKILLKDTKNMIL